MKKLSLFISLFFLFTAAINYTRSINITTPNGSTLYIDNNTTVAQLFRECRNFGFCEYTRRLVLYFDNYEIIENSEASNKTLWSFGNHVEYASIGYYNQSNYNNYNYDHKNRSISIRAANGMTTELKAYQTPAYFFRACRNAGNCANTAPMTLKFGTYEIKENTLAANKCFYEFNTDATYAYVMYWDSNSNINNDPDAALKDIGAGLGIVFCLGLYYLLR